MNTKLYLLKASIRNQFFFMFYTLILSLLTLIVFSNSILNGYNYDDVLVTQNQPLTADGSLSSIVKIFEGSYYKDATGHSFGYRPMVLLSFAIEHSLFSESPIVSHTINVLLYLVSVLLLFNLLCNFFGENKILIAFLASLLFIVHPVHSEVVASIKNRDEILAFFFAMLSGLMIFKYLKKESWYFLLLSFLFFAAGMLSKKSIYPLVVIYPFAILLLKTISRKNLLLVVLSLVIPGALIGSDFEISKLMLLIALPVLAVALFYFFYSSQEFKSNGNQNQFWLKESLLFIISWFFVGLALYKNNFGFVFLAILPLFISKLEVKKSIFQLMLQLLVIGFVLKINNCFLITLFTGAAYTFYSISNKKIDFLNSTILLVSIIGLFYLGMSFKKMFLIVYVLLFFYVSFRSTKLSLLFSATNFIVSLFYFQIGIFQISLLVFSLIIHFNYLKKYFLSYWRTGILLSVFSSLIFIGFELNYQSSIIKSLTKSSGGDVENIQEYLKKLPSKSEISEGRRLEYMENTLVAPHSINEKIATGIVVLGDYARLMVFPNELSFYYGYSKIKTSNFNDYRVWSYLLIYILLFFLAIYQINKRPIISFGIGWYFLSILLFSNWVELVAGMVGERLAFTASAGFCVFIAAIVYELKPSLDLFKPKKIELAVLAVLLLFSVKTFSRNSQWESPIKLMSHDIVHLENSAQANNMLALSLMSESLTNTTLSNEARMEYQKKAINYFSKAIVIYPYFFNYHFDLGRSYVMQKDFVNAKKAFFEAYKLQPENLLSLDELTKRSFDLKDKEETVKYGNLYLKINPYNENIHELVAYICLLNKDFISTKKYAERGLSYFPANENFKHMIIDSSH